MKGEKNEARMQYYKSYREKYRDKINKQQREYYANNKDRFKQYYENYWNKKNAELQKAKENCRC